MVSIYAESAARSRAARPPLPSPGRGIPVVRRKPPRRRSRIDKNGSGNAESGSALILALATIFIVTMAVLLAASMIRSRRANFDLQQRDVTLTALTDAAVAESLAGLDEDRNFSGVRARPFGRGTISSRVYFSGSTSRRLLAEAHYRGWTSTVEANIDLHGRHPVIVAWKWTKTPDAARQ